MIKTVLFDVDGVFLSEERYFDASALTVWELLMSDNYLGLSGKESFPTSYSDEEIAAIRARVFINDDVLNFLKSRGMNANWDMIYMTIADQLIHLVSQLSAEAREEAKVILSGDIDREALGVLKRLFKKNPVKPDFGRFLHDFADTNATKQELITYLNDVAEKRLGIKTDVFKPKSAFWHVGEHASQEWYVGDSNIVSSTGEPSVQPGKAGFLNDEVTLAEPKLIQRMFRVFKEKGLNIGIGTGRPRLETFEPFRYLNWLDELDQDHIVTADDVLQAEKAFDAAPLAKPHPFTYLAAFHGKNSDLQLWTPREPEKLENGQEVLIVGDSLADLLAARQIGSRFAAVLTGLSGQKARKEFEEHHADYILDSVADVEGLVLDLIDTKA